MQTAGVTVWHLWAKGASTHQQLTAVLHGHPHAIREVAAQRVCCHQSVLAQWFIALLVQPLACNRETAGNPMGGLHQRLVKAPLPCLGNSDTRTWGRSLRQQRVAPTGSRRLGAWQQVAHQWFGPTCRLGQRIWARRNFANNLVIEQTHSRGGICLAPCLERPLVDQRYGTHQFTPDRPLLCHLHN